MLYPLSYGRAFGSDLSLADRRCSMQQSRRSRQHRASTIPGLPRPTAFPAAPYICARKLRWGERRGSNPRSSGPQPDVLTTTLRPPRAFDCAGVGKWLHLSEARNMTLSPHPAPVNSNESALQPRFSCLSQSRQPATCRWTSGIRPWSPGLVGSICRGARLLS
jgi:hypothetical protein